MSEILTHRWFERWTGVVGSVVGIGVHLIEVEDAIGFSTSLDQAGVCVVVIWKVTSYEGTFSKIGIVINDVFALIILKNHIFDWNCVHFYTP